MFTHRFRLNQERTNERQGSLDEQGVTLPQKAVKKLLKQPEDFIPAVARRMKKVFQQLSVIRCFQYAIQDFRAYRRAHPGDMYLISYPKCGATWLQFMLAQIFAEAYGLQLDRLTTDLTHLTRAHSNLPTILWTHDGGEFIYEDGTRPDAERLFLYCGRLCYRKNRVILLVRDPRDVVVSLYYQVTGRSEKPMHFPNLSEFVHHPLYGFRRIIRFYSIWYWNRWVPRDMLLVKYEDLITDGINTLEEVAKFIGIKNVDGPLLQAVYEFSRADNMRQLEVAGKVNGMRLFGTERDALKVRRAQIGSYKDELSPSDIAYCNHLMRSLPKMYGYIPE